MNLKAAVESGKPFRHKSWEFYWDKDEFIEDFQGMVSYEEAISEDWEIQEALKETYTAEEVKNILWAAWMYDMRNARYSDFEKEAMKAAESSDEDMTSKSGERSGTIKSSHR